MPISRTCRPPLLQVSLRCSTKCRWDVEKVFDEFKNKLGETKSWASTPNTKTCQARLLCLPHNLMTLMEEQIFRETGIRNEAEIKRKAQTLANRDKDSRSKGCSGLTVLQKAIQRLTQRTVKFIRWLENHLDGRRSWPPSASPSSQNLYHLMTPKLGTVAFLYHS